MKTLEERMKINCEKAVNIIVGFIRKKVKQKQKKGVVLGLSGGIDSVTALFLATIALGSENVWALYLPERNSDKKFLKICQKVTDKLKVNFKIINIEEEIIKEKNIYQSLVIRIAGLSKVFNRFFIFLANKVISPIFFKERAFVLSLKHDKPEKSKIKKIINSIIRTVDKSFNIRHIKRREILEKFAQEKNLLLLGAANRSEFFVGWFVKGGVDDLPLGVLTGLYKTQVLQLARFVNVPKEIIEQSPSPDMLKGLGDEDIIGFSYDKIDKVAYVMEHGLDKELLLKEGISVKEFEGIKKLHQLSSWKRGTNYQFPVLNN